MQHYFSKVIKAGERKREFNFRQLPDKEGHRYYVDVPDDRGNRIVFQMYLDDSGHWRADMNPLPEWIIAAEAALGESIAESLPPAAPKRK